MKNGKKGMTKFGVSAGGKSMAKKTGAAPSQPGKVTNSTAGNTKFAADTGKGKMAGYTGAQNAKPA